MAGMIQTELASRCTGPLCRPIGLEEYCGPRSGGLRRPAEHMPPSGLKTEENASIGTSHEWPNRGPSELMEF
jgi:hypothetical protein